VGFLFVRFSPYFRTSYYHHWPPRNMGSMGQVLNTFMTIHLGNENGLPGNGGGPLRGGGGISRTIRRGGIR
jgi:hypothetical protein